MLRKKFFFILQDTKRKEKEHWQSNYKKYDLNANVSLH